MKGMSRLKICKVNVPFSSSRNSEQVTKVLLYSVPKNSMYVFVLVVII